MATKPLIIYLTYIATGFTGTIDVYSDVDNFVTPFETNLTSAQLATGYTTYNCPLQTTLIRFAADNLVCGYQPVDGMSVFSISFMTRQQVPELNWPISQTISGFCKSYTTYNVTYGTGYTNYTYIQNEHIRTGITDNSIFYAGRYNVCGIPWLSPGDCRNIYYTWQKIGNTNTAIQVITPPAQNPDVICPYAPDLPPTSTPTPTPTTTPTPTPSATPTPTPVPPTSTPTPTATNTPTPTPTLVPDLPTIITSGLTIFVDGSGTSYSGTGSQWFNRVTGTTITGATLSGSPTWNTSDNGFFTFDGVNDFGYFGQASTGTTTGSTTFGGWVKMTTGSTQEIIFQRGLGSVWSLFISKATNNKFTFAIVTSTFSQINCPAATTLTSGIWYYVTAVWTAGSSLKIYINGAISNTVANTSTTLRSNSADGWYLSRESSTDYDVSNIGDFEVYNRTLSDAEVLSNFNAKKTLYGY